MQSFRSTILATTFAAISAVAASADTIKIAMNGVADIETSAEYAFVVAFEKALAGSGMEVQLFPSGALGSEKERLAQTSQGLIEVNLAAATTAASISPKTRGLILPFMFSDVAEFDAVIAGSDLLEKLNGPLIESGLRIVGFNQIGMDAGLFNSKKPVAAIGDLAGLRMRALNKGQVAFFQSLGVSSTVVAWGEVANALQTNVVDGYVNPPNSALRTGHTQYLKHFTPIALTPSLRAVMVSEDWWSALSDAQRTSVAAAIAAGVAANRTWVVDWGRKVESRFSEAGVTVTELAPGEREKMRALAQTMHAEILSDGDLSDFRAALAAVGK